MSPGIRTQAKEASDICTRVQGAGDIEKVVHPIGLQDVTGGLVIVGTSAEVEKGSVFAQEVSRGPVSLVKTALLPSGSTLRAGGFIAGYTFFNAMLHEKNIGHFSCRRSIDLPSHNSGMLFPVARTKNQHLVTPSADKTIP